MIKILDSNYVRLGAIKSTLSANRLEKINGENTLDYSATLSGTVLEFVNENTIYELDNDYFDTALFSKQANDDGTFTVDVEAEHISYRLNNPEYNVDYFTEIGLPSYILGKVLEGTNFTVGTVEFSTSITYSAQEAKSRRQLLMELVAYLGGEVSFDKFQVNILTHRGSTEIVSVTKDRNVKVVSKTVNKRQKDKDGNNLVSYACSPIYIPGDTYSLGDNVVLLQKTIGLNEQLRVVSISKNPYDEMQTIFEFANYTNGLESALFRIETNTIAKNKLYYGARISPEMGFESIRSDLKARTIMNADTFAMQAGDGTGLWYNKLWFDPELGLYIFDGTLSADAINAIKAEIDVVISNTTITNVISAQKGNIAELTVDQIDTSDKVKRYLLPDTDPLRKAPIGYWRGYDEFIEFVEAIYAGDLEGGGSSGYQSWTNYPDSPVLTSNYPYQFIEFNGDYNIYLHYSTAPFRIKYGSPTAGGATIYYHRLINGSWGVQGSDGTAIGGTIGYRESNNNIYNDDSLSTIYFAKTTTIEQDGGTTGGPQTEQVKNRDNQNLYWLDAEHIGTGITTDVTDYPVMQFVYNEAVKLKLFHEIDPVSGYAIPKMIWGAGNPAGRQKGYIYKDTDGMVIAYENAAGEMREIRLDENGIFITPYELERLSFNSSGFSMTYSGETISYGWAKDGSGRITQLEVDGRTIPITWG